MHVNLKNYDNDFIYGWVKMDNDKIPPKANNEESVITLGIKKLKKSHKTCCVHC